MCSQNIYPGDDQLLNMEKEILNIKYKILDDPAYKTNSVPEMSEEELQVIFSNELFVDIKCVLEINHHICKKMF